MAVIKYQRGSTTSVLTTELNGMSVGNRVLSAAIDNTTDLYLFEDLLLSTAAIGSAFDAGGIFSVFLIEAMDDTNYVDGNASTEPAQNDMVGSFNVRAVTSAQKHTVRGITLPPTKYKYLIKNEAGQSLAASGSTLQRRAYRYQSG